MIRSTAEPPHQRLFLCPIVHLAAALTQDVPPSSKGGTVQRTLVPASRGRGTMRNGRGCIPGRGVGHALRTWLRILCAWGASARGELWRLLWSITSSHIKATKAGSGIGATGPACVCDATTARLRPKMVDSAIAVRDVMQHQTGGAYQNVWGLLSYIDRKSVV